VPTATPPPAGWRCSGSRALPTDFLDDEDDGELLDAGLGPTEAPRRQGSRQLPAPAAPSEAPATPAAPTPRRSRALSWAARQLPLFLGRAPPPRPAARPSKVYVTRVRPGLRAPPGAPPLGARGPPRPPLPGVFLRPRPLPRVPLRAPPRPPRARGHRTSSPPATELRAPAPAPATREGREGRARAPGLAAPTADSNSSSEAQPVTSFLSLSQVSRPQLPGEDEEEEGDDDEEGAPGDENASEDSEEAAGLVRGRWREDAIDWQRTFSVGNVDFELLRSDWNDLRCNVSGNLQLPEAEAVDVVAQYMERLNMRHSGYGAGVPWEGRGLASMGPSALPQGLTRHCSGSGTHPHAHTTVGKCLLSLLGPLSCVRRLPLTAQGWLLCPANPSPATLDLD